MSFKKHIAIREVNNYLRVGSSKNTTDAIFQFLSGLDTPKSLAIWLLYSNNEHIAMLDLDCNPLDYICKYKFRDDYSAVSFLSKADFLKTGYDKKQRALKKFAEYEELCLQTNRRFRYPCSDPLFSGLNVSLLNAMKRKIEDILGDFTADEFLENCSWGPGVSTLVKGDNTSASHKFSYETGILQQTYQWVKEIRLFSHVHPDWEEVLTASDGTYSCSVQLGNTICTVPKNSKTDRVIAVEPGINMFMQKSIGKMMKRRLLRHGVDLSDQGINQERCKHALDLGLATVDFSSASDSISKSVVEYLLPRKWYTILELLRSPCYVSTNKGANQVSAQNIERSTPWNKFSSMGNGFTFELESLIFFAAASVVMAELKLEGRPSVYGDDVILPNDAYELFSSFSAFLGFRVNPEKSFSSGLFRESCGVHYFDGLDVQPIYLKGKLTNVQSIFKLANSVRLLAHRRCSYYGCDRKLLRTVRHLRDRVPKHLCFLVPASNLSAGFISNLDEACPQRAPRGWEGFQYTGISTSPCLEYTEHLGHLVSKVWAFGANNGILPLLRTDTTSNHALSTSREWPLKYIAAAQKKEESSDVVATGNDVPKRARVTVSINTKFICNRWYNLGPWM